jgi:hypothetical protein
MSRKIRRSVVVLAVTLVLLMIGVAPVYAETPSGEGPFDTMAPTGEWMKL